MGIVQSSAGRPGFEPCANAVMDCSYVAASTARILSRFDRHGLDVVAFQVQVCLQSAEACVRSCAPYTREEALAKLARSSRACVDACASLLRVLGARPVLTTDDEPPQVAASATVGRAL